MKTYSRIRSGIPVVRFRRFHIRPSAVWCAVLLAPMGTALEIPADSTMGYPPLDPESEKITRFSFGAGSGSYGRSVHTSRTIFLGYDSCTGEDVTQTVDADFNFKDEYKDYGGEIDVQVSKKGHVGIRGGKIDETVSYLGSSIDQAVIDTLFAGVAQNDTSFSYTYLNPFFSVEGDKMGFGLGVVFSDNRLWTGDKQEYGDHNDGTVFPTGHLRFGNLDKIYMKFSMWEGVPIYSGGGQYVVGVGARPAPPLHLFAGLANGGPYSDNSYLLRGDVDLGRYFALGGTFRLSTDADATFVPTFEESGGSVALTYKLHH